MVYTLLHWYRHNPYHVSWRWSPSFYMTQIFTDYKTPHLHDVQTLGGTFMLRSDLFQTDGIFSGVRYSLKRKWRHFDGILITGCTGSCHFDNFQCSQWWKFHQNEDISVSVFNRLTLLAWLECSRGLVEITASLLIAGVSHLPKYVLFRCL